MTSLSSFLQNITVRWIITNTWTTLTFYLTLSPSGEGTTVTWVSRLFGGTETTDAIGHVFINMVLALLWCWTTGFYTSTGRTVYIVLVGGGFWCFAAELSQFFVPDRGLSLLDLGANILGVLIGLLIYRRLVAWSTKTNPSQK